MKKLLLRIKVWLFYTGYFFNSFFYGLASAMKQGDKMLSTSQKGEADDNQVGIEQHVKQDNVFSDLIRGIVTERVKEARHELYLAERKSYGYEYAGGGRARKKKKNTMFDSKLSNETGNKDAEIILVMDNELLSPGMDEIANNQMFVDNFRIKFIPKFYPRFRLDRYCTKIIIEKQREKNIPDNEYILSAYFSKFPQNRPSAFFVKELEKINAGDKQSEVLDILSINFFVNSEKAQGKESVNGVEKTYSNPRFIKINENDSFYILQFRVNKEEDKDFFYDKGLYHEATAEKIKNKAPRENHNGGTANLDTYKE